MLMIKNLKLNRKVNKKQGVKKEIDEDPNGEKLAETTTPLEEAAKYIVKLKFYAQSQNNRQQTTTPRQRTHIYTQYYRCARHMSTNHISLLQHIH